MGLTKVRWSRMGMEADEVKRLLEKGEIEEQEKIDEIIRTEESEFVEEISDIDMMKNMRRYEKEFCRKEGSQEHHQLTKEGEIHVSPSDKGKGLVVMSTDMYHEMAVVHTHGDRRVE